jgi:Polysaccharide biosynthesis protein/Glycosyl transferase family 2
VPAGKQSLTATELSILRRRTADLLSVAAESGEAEFRRFQAMKNRGLVVDAGGLDQLHRDRTILVTGGTGCIGSSLLAELSRLRPERLVSISRGISTPWSVTAGVEYQQVDIRDRDGLERIFDRVKPDVVYHLAAQHDPGLAEIEVARTLSTNLTGSANVFDASASHGSTLIHASTGKALRPFSRDIYAASKKLSEWLLGQAVGTHQLVGAAARFTHVVDNSIICERLRTWTRTGSPIRLHSPTTSFYMQSAREAAQLLMCAGLDATSGPLRLAAIRDLGWPISLMDLAVGWLSTCREPVPLYICGFEAGYRDATYPGLYDPRISGDRSPLFNALEVPMANSSKHCDDVDVCVVGTPANIRPLAVIRDLGDAAARGADSAELREIVSECGWSTLSSSVRALPSETLSRHLNLIQQVPHNSFDRTDRDVVNIVYWEMHERAQAHDFDSVVPTREPARGGSATDELPPTGAYEVSTTSHLDRGLPSVVDLTVLIPTFNERDNIPALVERLASVCRDQPIEVLFVDDSLDDTPQVILAAARTAEIPIRLIHRAGDERVGGLSGAVATGMGAALGRYILVMDGDLQHPPELVPVLREIVSEPGVHLAVATRYSANRRVLGLDGAWRQSVSLASTAAAKTLFPRRVGSKCSDPMTGFFCLDKEAVDFEKLKPQGFKILLEILVKHDLTVREVPFVFEDRFAGDSKATWRQGMVFLRQLVQLRSGLV